MKKFTPFLFIVSIIAIVAFAISQINQSEQHHYSETWSAFVYTHGYNSGRYQKTDDFSDYQQCKTFAQQQSADQGDVVWQCGLNCRFDSSRQGFQCETMKNH
ncbi:MULTISPECIES: hypothetical protein [Shewanella]|uniref:hypothetical protein n=1 Tax=Shewanella TaxID=22 RepID=UPI000491DB2A|nr:MULTISPECIES: hypothetical protein [Shewanella]QLE87048.1 hypothetical protein FLM48_19410 [Shewanella sp. Scap07]